MQKLSKSYKQEKPKGSYDAIIVGSGIGALSAGAFMAKEGKKVLILERHYTPGGFTHVFRRKDYVWDVGVHYIGEVHRPKAILTKIFNYVSNSNLKWAEMGEVYDKIVFGKKVYEYHAGVEEFRSKMKEYFQAPEDQQAIDVYLEQVRQTQREQFNLLKEKAMPMWLRWFLGKGLRKKGLRGNETTLSALSRITQNKQLIGVLTGQYGDYGMPPGQSSWLMHTALFKHYINGGSYPVGGSAQFYNTIAPVILNAGGDVYTNAEVKEIIVKNNKAVGVKMFDGAELFAPVIISDAGIINTYAHLLPTVTGEQKEQLQQMVSRVKPSVGHVCLYIGLNHPKASLNLQKANYWIYPDNYDHDQNIQNYLNNPDSEFPVVYISFPTAKDPDWEKNHPNHSTIEIITLAPYEWYSAWADKRWMKRGEDYNTAKEKLSQRLLEKLYEFEPQLRGKIDHYELSTPLSTQHFVNYRFGEIYGIDHSPERFNLDFLRPETPIKNLYLTGQDIISCGVGGALVGGMLTASKVTGKNLMKRLPANE